MKVFFGTTTRELERYIDVYRQIRRELINLNCIILKDWLLETYDFKRKYPKAQRSKERHYKAITNAIKNSDFVVIEFTVPNFSSSHQITYALSRQKPVLVLRMEKDNSFADSYLEWIDSDLLTIVDYKIENISIVLKEFIGIQKIDSGFKRYNVVLKGRHKYYLDWAQKKQEKSRSEILRNAIDEKMEKDKDFKKYLGE